MRGRVGLAACVTVLGSVLAIEGPVAEAGLSLSPSPEHTANAYLDP